MRWPHCSQSAARTHEFYLSCILCGPQRYFKIRQIADGELESSLCSDHCMTRLCHRLHANYVKYLIGPTQDGMYVSFSQRFMVFPAGAHRAPPAIHSLLDHSPLLNWGFCDHYVFLFGDQDPSQCELRPLIKT